MCWVLKYHGECGGEEGFCLRLNKIIDQYQDSIGRMFDLVLLGSKLPQTYIIPSQKRFTYLCKLFLGLLGEREDELSFHCWQFTMLQKLMSICPLFARLKSVMMRKSITIYPWYSSVLLTYCPLLWLYDFFSYSQISESLCRLPCYTWSDLMNSTCKWY